MRIFTSIDAVREYAIECATQERIAQLRYQGALDMLDAGKTKSEIGTRYGFQPQGKGALRKQVQRTGGAAMAYENMADAIASLTITCPSCDLGIVADAVALQATRSAS